MSVSRARMANVVGRRSYSSRTTQYRRLPAGLRRTGWAAAAIVTLCSLPMTGAWADQVFSILRNDKDLGWQKVSFQRQGDRLQVQVTGQAEYKIGTLVLYRYQLRRTESWENGKLIAFAAWTDDDGKVSEVQGRREGETFRVAGPRGVTQAPATALPGNLWNAQIVQASHIIDNETGQAAPLQAVTGELETVEACGGQVQARHYRLTGKESQDVWYDERGHWVRMELTARDMSKIAFVLRAAAAPNLALSGPAACGS